MFRTALSSSKGGRDIDHLVLDEVSRVVRVAVLQQEVFVDRPGHHARLQPAESLNKRVARGDTPHGHGIVEVDILRRRFLM